MAEAQVQTAAPQLPKIAKAAMSFQVWLLRRGLMGSLGNEIMVITVSGTQERAAVLHPDRFSARRRHDHRVVARLELVQERRRHGSSASGNQETEDERAR